MTALQLLPRPHETEAHRRRMLEETDELLTRVEEIRLADRRAVPRDLQEAVRELQVRIGWIDRRRGRPSLDRIHDAIFAIQERLMSANPRRETTRRHLGRAAGSPAVEPIRPGIDWKLLVLPARPSAAEHSAEWRELVSETVERALERWFYAQHHAVIAARKRRRAVAAVMVARVAWNNYWELLEEAARIEARLGAPPGRAR